MNALIAANQDAFWSVARSYRELQKTVVKIANHEPLTDTEWEIALLASQVKIPQWHIEHQMKITEKMSKIWEEVRSTYLEITKRILPNVEDVKIHVYTSYVWHSGVDGSAYPPNVIVIGIPAVGSPKKEDLIHELVHESLHIIQWLAGYDEPLRKTEKKIGLPLREALTETLTNIILWRAGITKVMFAEYYDSSWKELCELEDRVRKIVANWLKSGGNLLEMLQKEI